MDYIAGDSEKISGLLSAVINDFVVVQIDLDSSDRPEKIFESINASGRNLSEFDLLRNNALPLIGRRKSNIF